MLKWHIIVTEWSIIKYTDCVSHTWNLVFGVSALIQDINTEPSVPDMHITGQLTHRGQVTNICVSELG